jgi:hypothetical protein
MRSIVVNTKQKTAVLAAGLVVATTGLVTDQAAAGGPPSHAPATHRRAHPVVRKDMRQVLDETNAQIGAER